MSKSADPRLLHVRYRDEIKLLIIFVLTALPAIGVAQMLVRAVGDEDSTGTPASPLIDSLGALVQPLGFNKLIVGSILLGFALGMLVLLFFDYQKRVQAVLLSIAVVFSALILGTQLSNIGGRLGVAELFAAFGGLLVGVVAVGRRRLQYIQIGDTSRMSSARTVGGRGQKPLRFPLAEKLLFWILLIVVVIGFFEAHTTYEQILTYKSSDGALVVHSGSYNFGLADVSSSLVVLDIISSGVMLAAMSWFLGYESNRSVFVLGPSGSGKTHLSIAMYLKAQEMGFRPRNSTDEVTHLVQRIIDEEDFIPERTRDVQDLSFEFTAGRYFPTNVQLDAFDYPGEYLPHIPGGLEVYYDELSRYDYEDLIREQIDEGVAIDQGKGLSIQQDSSGVATDGGTEEQDSTEQVHSKELNASETGNGTGGTSTESSDMGEAPTAAIDVGDEVIRERAKVMTNEVCPRVANADLLVLLVDIERMLNDVPLGTEWYSNILARLPDDQEAIIVATKADLLLPDARGEDMGDMIDPAKRRDKVDRTVREHAGVGRLPIAEKPYPVFYKTYEEDGERHIEMRSPMSADAELQQDVARKWPSLYGYSELLRRLGR